MALLRSARSVLVASHLNPDGDAIGASLAMSYALDQLGVRHEVVNHNPVPFNLRFLAGGERIQPASTQDHDLGIVLDLNTLDRLGSHRESFAALDPLIVIDHHQPSDPLGNLRLVDVSAPATCLVLYRLFKHLPITFTPELANALLAGIVTDTGSFRYRNTTPESLTIAADLLAHGGNLSQINEEVYGKRSLASVLLLRRMLDNMELLADGRLAISTLSAEDFAEAEAIESQTEGLVNELLAIESVRIAALVRQPAHDKVVRSSLRSREPYDVASAVRPLGGGGHRNAAGCTFETSLSEATETLKEVLLSWLE